MNRVFILSALILVLASANSSSGQTLEVVPSRAAVDETVVIRASGLQPGERVSIAAELTDSAQALWKSDADFVADAQGVVDTSKQAPESGSYKGIYAMGLVLFMKPDARDVAGYRPPSNGGKQLIQFFLKRNGQTAATADLEQYGVADGVRQIKLEGALQGILFLPDASGPVPGVLVVGGSEGGLPGARAAWLASHGYAALALAYFRYGDLPHQLAGIPLEYFGEAIAWMRQRPEILPDQIAVMGASRGGELALQLGSMFPEIKAVVAYVPANVLYPACCGDTSVPYAWTWKGAPLNYISARDARNPMEADASEQLQAAIPVERTKGPILMISGGDDHVWNSTTMADAVVSRLKQTHFPYSFANLKYERAGHRAGRPELFPEWHSSDTRVASGEELSFGGSVEGDAESSLDAIPKVLAFLSQSLQSPVSKP